MNSILNHNLNENKPSSPKESIRNQLKMPSEINNSNSNFSQVNRSKYTMQQLYKNQLDSFMQQKQKQRKLQKQLLQKQKEQYREMVKIGQSNEKMKDIAYKNYYKMLMQSHDQNSQTYVSPYQQRDKLKDSHIQYSIQQQIRKSQNFDYEKKIYELQRKNQYKQQLMRQMQQRKRQNQINKLSTQQQNAYFRKNTRNPVQIQQYERQRKKQQMHIYKHDLDQLMQVKMAQSRKSNELNSQTQPRIKYSDDYHNPLINPLPYNIQNPYILREMQKASSVHVRKDSNLFDQQNKYHFQQRPRNQSSYFARQGNKLLK